MDDLKNKPKEYWKEKLTSDEYFVTREKETERPFSGKYDDFFEEGKYVCVNCGHELFSSETKFNAGCGWPSFYKAQTEKNVERHEDVSHGMQRVEVVCSNCGAHLGHVFNDGPPPTGERFCINSVALRFQPKK